MPDKSFKISIATPERSLFDGEASSLIAPGKSGYFGVLVDHAPLIALLGPGKITIKYGTSGVTVFDCKSAGILEVLKNNVSILIEDSIGIVDDAEKTE
ncbi:MAG: F0F1 ATP synthase subunit epsilon [Candidatus Omnitrophica bacterium]|nr:F0F1 ATP synthase subunit epsilon [Candidatus Omnitrophota bacterium]MDD5737599.1 F0F1 ATP synthase subunit epsilon [Candidatus Omnitrophota bacterium]